MKAAFTKVSLFTLCLLAGFQALAQQQVPLDIALRYLEQQREPWQLSEADVKGVAVSSQHVNRRTGVTHLYFIQRHAGIELYNAISGVHIGSDGRVVYATNRFTPDLASRVNTTSPSLTAYQAIEAAATHLQLTMDGPLRLLEQPAARQSRYEGGNVSDSDINVKLMYQLVDGGQARLAWDLAIDMPTSADYWSLRVDALTGEVLDQHNWTVYCSFDAGHDHEQGCGVSERRQQQFRPLKEALEMGNRSVLNDNAQYNVYALPVESPKHGDRSIVENPADPVASPYGWHDTNGQPGAEYRITRGNNVHAYLDLDNDGIPAGDEPNGGDELIFDFPIDLTQEPSAYREAAVTQLFYVNNFLHDFAYAYGFDEAAGNFQQNNYGNGGSGGDYVLAQAQDGGGTNNANFSTPPDGFNGQMQMYLFNSSGSIFRVTSPQPAAGGYEVLGAAFGAPITTTPVTGPIVEVNDGSSEPNLGCNALINTEQLQGAIALIDRGSCEFGLKALNAENAGAIGVIICNFEDALVSMGAGVFGGPVSIPVISMQFSDCQVLRQYIGQDLIATFQAPAGGVSLLDGDLDNGIIAHEYGHGISIRLTGGAMNSGCLGNNEQMGEGWSDFFALVTTVKPGDTGAMGRGVGTYAQGQEPTGPGFRRRRYSTDFTVNNQVLDDIKGTTSPHALGEVWAATLWDLYWAFVDEYGWDEDAINGTGGNNMAIQLVMDGMRLQPCEPGFIDGRDAILAADQMLYDGIHECLIWGVFARRGIGYFAEQGSSGNRNDNVQNFDSRPECIKELKIAKSVTPFIQPGEEITVTLGLVNHKGETASGVVVEDQIPAGAFFIAGSETGGAPVEVIGDIVKFDLGDIANGEARAITYRLGTDPGLRSTRLYIDDLEQGDENWFFNNLEPNGFDIWYRTDENAYSGNYSWYVPNTNLENDQIIQLIEPLQITGDKPALRFFHSYDTELGVDGGFLEVSTDGGNAWQKVDDKMIRNGYSGRLDYGTLAIPFLQAFYGNSNGWQATYVDLSAFSGEELTLRFRFGSNDNTAPASLNPGWYVDDIELMSLFNYNSEACVSSAQGDLACAMADSEGAIVESGLVSSSRDEASAARISVFPNPASNTLNIGITLSQAQTVAANLVSGEGRVLAEQKIDAPAGFQLIPMDVSKLPAGFYFVKVYAGQQTAVEKVIIR